MAGLIEQNMAAPQPQPAGVQAGMPQRGMMPKGAEGEGPDADTDPGYRQAMEFAMTALYEGKAARDIAQALKGAQNAPDALANTAYEIVSIVDERTDGAVPDELLVLFASRILEEVAEIADAAGVAPSGEDVALAMKQMILRYLGEQGVDTTQLQQAMDQVNPADLAQAADTMPGDEQAEEMQEY